MALLLTPAHEQNTTLWSGGTTTQLCIYPYAATYTGRDFIFRISTATIESEESVFTKLPGYTRILMLLEGHTSATRGSTVNKCSLLIAIASEEIGTPFQKAKQLTLM